MNTSQHMDLVATYSANNYAPLPVVIARGHGSWVEDVEGHKYLDMLGAYSALNFGHAHPRIVETFVEQAKRLTLTSRAFQNDQFGPFCQEITALCGQDMVLPMNSGAEAVETALKTVRKWGYRVKDVPADRAEIICCDNNFHGRTITIISFARDPQFREGFGPFTPGFTIVPFGDASALEQAITPHTVGFLFEPIQAEGGIVVPPSGYLKQVREICTRHHVLMIADEIQVGLGRTGRNFACDHEEVKPDVLILGKALGGGMMPVSATLASKTIMGVFNPGDHGSTFGGNPLACAVARTALKVLTEEKLAERAAQLGEKLMSRLRGIKSSVVTDIRGRGLLIGLVFKPEPGVGKKFCKRFMEVGILCKETVDNVVRLAPPLTVAEEDLDWALERIEPVIR